MRLASLYAALAVLLGGTSPTAGRIAPNDNRHPAGRLAGGVLTVALEAREGSWCPEGPQGHCLPVAAWAEPGKPLQNPGPLLRVPVGSEVRATLRNGLARPMTVRGLGPGDSLVLAAGETRAVRFAAAAAGTYYYTGRTTTGFFGGLDEDSQLNGAIVVDAPDASPAVRAANDRVFLISWYFTVDSTSRTGLGRGTMAINGLAWPHTERVDLAQGDSVRWRVINTTGADHPMHLHGFYFRVDAKGDGARDTVYAAADRRMAVTEVVLPGQTASLAWAPARPGNWIFHCHYHSHISHLSSLDTERGETSHHTMATHGSDRPHEMFGLVLGIRVAPRASMVAAVPAAARRARALRILVRERPNVYGAYPGYAFVLGGSEDDRSGAMPVPARPLVLTRGEPVAITVVNRATSPASIHWHGIELESYPDGVPGWSGAGQHVLPSIAPGDSLTVSFTPPRAGTFMYHSHFNEWQQISNGQYGAILVLEPGERYDPETDRVLVVAKAGMTGNVIAGPFAPLTINGKADPDPIELRAGTAYRLRVINISDDFPTLLGLFDGERPATWRAIAKDGADLPASQARVGPAVLLTDPGEIHDFRFTPERAGELTLRFGHPQFPGIPPTRQGTVAVRVR